MNKSKTIEIDGIGPVMFVKSRRARKLNISLEPSDVLRVAVPYWTSFKEAMKIISSNIGWVRKYLARMERARRQHDLLFRDQVTVDRAEAAERILGRVSEIAEEHGFTFNRSSIRNQKTRWGSCSHKNNISLNVKLARLPAELIDYVILHELLHTRIKNHKDDFWTELTRILPGARALDARLRKYHLALM